MMTVIKKLLSQPTEPANIRDSWYIKFCIWGLAYWGLGTFSIIFPAIATAVPESGKPYFTVLATITSGIIVFLSPKDQKDKFNVAWILLNAAINNKENTVEAIRRGESIINGASLQKYAPDFYVSPSRSKRHEN